MLGGGRGEKKGGGGGRRRGEGGWGRERKGGREIGEEKDKEEKRRIRRGCRFILRECIGFPWQPTLKARQTCLAISFSLAERKTGYLFSLPCSSLSTLPSSA